MAGIRISQLPAGTTSEAADYFAVAQDAEANLGSTLKFTAAQIARGILSFANVKAFGAVGDGVTVDTVAFQAAVDSLASGGTLFIPAGNFVINSNIFLPSNIAVVGVGSGSQLKAAPTWVNGPAGSSPWITALPRTLFINQNWTNIAITDEKILLQNFSVDLDLASAPVRKGLCAFVAAKNIIVQNVISTGGGTVCSFLHTENSMVVNCIFEDMHSCGADHYSGFANAWVGFNRMLQTAVSSSNPVIQFTGTNNDNTFNTSDGVVCIGNIVTVGGSFASNVGAISITAAGAGGSVLNACIANNNVDAGGRPVGGILCYGGGENWQILGNTVRGVSDYNAIFALPNGYGSVSYAHVANNRILNSSRTSVSGRLLSVIADGSTVVDNDILNSVCVTTTYVEGNACLLRMGSSANTTYTNIYLVSGTVSIDGEISGTWTPTLEFNGDPTGITYTTQEGKYVRQGNMVYVECSIVLSNKGAVVGNATITGQPFTDPVGSTPPSRLFPTVFSNVTSITEEPYIFVSDDTIVLRSGVISPTNLTDANFNNNTNLFFCGWYRAG